MIRAINKDGRQRDFTERVWSMMPKHKNGWVEYEAQGEVLVPQQIIEFQQKKKEAAAVVVENIKSSEPEMDTKVKPPVKRRTKKIKK
jgi:hypothetical protein